jgi:hypothetical protein
VALEQDALHLCLALRRRRRREVRSLVTPPARREVRCPHAARARAGSRAAGEALAVHARLVRV